MKKEQQRLDKILESVCRRIEDEVSSLIGATFVLTDCQKQFISKEDAFEQLGGKQVVAKLDVVGDHEGNACLLIGIKDAVRLGGTLIMLPDNALEEAVTAEAYDEDTADSFGEIANIIAGSYTKVFEEMYPEPCRFVRKTYEVVIPAKVNVAAEEPVPDQLYYQVSTGMKLNDRSIGNMVVLLPAATFKLELEEAAEPVAAPEPPTAQVKNTIPDSAPPIVETPSVEPVVNVATKDFDVKKHQKRVDALLEECRQKLGSEVGALLGVEVSLTNQEYRLVSKEDYFLEEANGKQILAYMDVVGDLQDKSYLFVGLKDAIFIGGTLIMLPPVELDRAVQEEEFNDDTKDAYSEIANIVSGVYTSVFEEQYVKKLRFIKTEIEQVLPLKVDTEADTPMPNQFYYMSSATLNISGRSLGKMQMLFPAPLLQLERLLQQEGEADAPVLEQSPAAAPAVAGEAAVYQGIDVLIVSDDTSEAVKIQRVLEQGRRNAKILSFKENTADYLPGEVKAVFLVMKEVNEKAFAVAIKIHSVCSLPLIAAGPGWTRSKVIAAVRYGVDDILLTPATEGDIGEKIEAFSARLAA